MEIIVLKHTPYKEKDAILEALSEDGNNSYLVKGLMSPKSPNIVLSNVLVLADIELEEGKYKHPLVKKSKIISSPYHLGDTLDKLGAITLIDEITINLLQEEERVALYSDLKKLIKDIEKNKTDIRSLILIYFMKVLREAGYSFEVNKCVKCGTKKNIATFSFSSGGFVCKDCLEEESLNLSKEAMLSIRKAVLASGYQDIEELTDESFKEVLKALDEFVYDSLGVKLKSTEFLI